MEPIGDASKARLFAASIDNVLAAILGLVVASKLPGISGAVRTGILAIIYIGYFFILEGAWSRTLGKQVFGLGVHTSDGSRCGWRGAAIRSALRLFEVNPVLFGGLPAGLAIAFSKRRQRFGDMLAGTVVVRTAQSFPASRPGV